jgi:hypothetical protein
MDVPVVDTPWEPGADFVIHVSLHDTSGKWRLYTHPPPKERWQDYEPVWPRGHVWSAFNRDDLTQSGLRWRPDILESLRRHLGRVLDDGAPNLRLVIARRPYAGSTTQSWTVPLPVGRRAAWACIREAVGDCSRIIASELGRPNRRYVAGEVKHFCAALLLKGHGRLGVCSLREASRRLAAPISTVRRWHEAAKRRRQAFEPEIETGGATAHTPAKP